MDNLARTPAMTSRLALSAWVGAVLMTVSPIAPVAVAAPGDELPLIAAVRAEDVAEVRTLEADKDTSKGKSESASKPASAQERQLQSVSSLLARGQVTLFDASAKQKKESARREQLQYQKDRPRPHRRAPRDPH